MNNEFDRPATQGEAYNEMVANIGQDRPNDQWILTPYDSWERNPSYFGSEQPHPEDEQANLAQAEHDQHGDVNDAPDSDPLESDPRFHPSEDMDGANWI